MQMSVLRERTSKFGVDMSTMRGLNVPKIICGNMRKEGPSKCSTLRSTRRQPST